MSHALLSPSAAHRWLHCTPSAVLASKVEDKGSKYAEEGTCAHAMGAMLLLQHLGRDNSQAKAEYDSLKGAYHTPEMNDAVEMYYTTVLQKWDKARLSDPMARIYIERRLDFSAYAPESFGTADCVILADGCMEVIDYKHGKGVEVSADHNPQMMIYALGAYDEFLLDYDINEVCMTIIQPRIGNVSECRMPLSELLDWGNRQLKPAAEVAFRGEGELFPGDHCRFCPIKSNCTALALRAVDAWRCNKEVKVLPDSALSECLKLIPMIEQWAAAVKERGLSLALDGTPPEGFKLVEGRSIRVITDPETLAESLSTLGEEVAESIYRPRELKTIGDLEKLVGKKQFAELSKGCIEKPAGKPTLVPVTDKRAEITINKEDAVKADFEALK